MHTPEIIAQHLLRQSNKLDELCAQASAQVSARSFSMHDGDRVYAPLVGHAIFEQGSVAAQDLIFQIPENLKFEVERVQFFVGFRLKTTNADVDGPSERTFRPCVFTHYEQANYPRVQYDPASMDVLIQISETYIDAKGQSRSRVLQNMPTPVAHFYSGAISMRQTSSNFAAPNNADLYYANFSFPSGFLFAKPWELPGGSSVTIKVSPIFAGVRFDPAYNTSAPNVTALNEYRFTAVLDGFKRVTP